MTDHAVKAYYAALQWDEDMEAYARMNKGNRVRARIAFREDPLAVNHSVDVEIRSFSKMGLCYVILWFADEALAALEVTSGARFLISLDSEPAAVGVVI